jgi:N-acyl-L-homoserine lactone synthetase
MSQVSVQKRGGTDKSKYQSIEAKGPLLDKVYSLRYQSYSEKGYIEKRISKLFIDEYDNQPFVKSYLAYCENDVIGSIRICEYDPTRGNSVPALEMYKKELSQKIGLSNRFVEANRFVIKPSYQKKLGMEARFTIFQSVVDSALSVNANAIVIAVREEHVGFYKILKCFPISACKKYHGVNFNTVLLSCTDISKAKSIINRVLRKARTE